jgi:hypothetical protein
MRSLTGFLVVGRPFGSIHPAPAKLPVCRSTGQKKFKLKFIAITLRSFPKV